MRLYSISIFAIMNGNSFDRSSWIATIQGSFLMTKFVNIMTKDMFMKNMLLSLLVYKKCEKSTCFQTSARSFIHSFWKMSACEKIARISLVFFNLIILGISGCLIFAAVVLNNEIYDLFIPSYEVSFKICNLNHKRHRVHRPPLRAIMTWE